MRPETSKLLITACRKGLGACAIAANLLFALVLCAQVALAVMIWQGREIPIPERVRERVSVQLRDRGLTIAFQEAHFDLAGGVRASGVEISDLDGHVLARAEQLFAEIDLSAILCADGIRGRIVVDDASLILPPHLSVDGTQRSVVSDLDAEIKLEDEALQIVHLQFVANGVPVVAAGRVQLPESSQAPSASLSGRIAGSLRQLDSHSLIASHLERPSIHLRIGGDGIEARLMTQGLEYEGWNIGPTILQVGADSAFHLGRLEIQSGFVKGPGVSLGQVAARLTPEVGYIPGSRPLLEVSAKAELSIASASARGETANGLHLGLSRKPGKTFARVSLFQDTLPSTLEAEVSDDGQGVAGFALRTRHGILLRLAGVPEDEVAKRLTIAEPLALRGRVCFGGEAAPQATFDMEALGLDVRGAAIEYVHVAGRANEKRIDCDELLIHSQGAVQSGSFHQDLTNRRWRFLLKGDVYPPQIGPILGAWWDEIWPDFVFDGPRVQGDLDIAGRWGETHYADIFGSVQLRHLLYNGVRIDKGTLTLVCGDGYVDLQDIDAATPDGRLTGSLGLILPRGDPMSVTFSLDSTLPVDQLDRAFGSTMSEMLPEWTFDRNPNVKMIGNLLHLADGSWRSDLVADATADAGSWRGVKFDALSLRVAYVGRDVDVQIHKAATLGGSLAGTVRIPRHEGPMPLELNLAIEKASLALCADAFEKLGLGDMGGATTRSGVIDLSLSVAARAPDMGANAAGEGRFAIAKADFGKIKVFGALSTLFDSIGFSFGTFKLDRAEGRFTLKEGRAKITDSRIEGPSARIEMDGFFGLVTHAMDFDVKVFLLQPPKPSLMSLFGAVLNPIGHIMELSLKGTYSEPRWRFKIDPRNLFDDNGEGVPAIKNEGAEAVSP